MHGISRLTHPGEALTLDLVQTSTSSNSINRHTMSNNALYVRPARCDRRSKHRCDLGQRLSLCRQVSATPTGSVQENANDISPLPRIQIPAARARFNISALQRRQAELHIDLHHYWSVYVSVFSVWRQGVPVRVPVQRELKERVSNTLQRYNIGIDTTS
jgi:hypothetical protein